MPVSLPNIKTNTAAALVFLLVGVSVGLGLYFSHHPEEPEASSSSHRPLASLLVPVATGGFLAFCTQFPHFVQTMFHPIITANGVCNLFLNATGIALFIGVFFFTYATIVEQRVVQTQTDLIVKNISETAKALAPDAAAHLGSTMSATSTLCVMKKHRGDCDADHNCTWKGGVCSLKPVAMDKPDTDACEKNRSIKKKAMSFLVLGFGGAVALLALVFAWGWLGKKYKWGEGKKIPHYPESLSTWQQLVKILLITLVSIVFVGVTEFCFLRFMGSNFRTADPNLVKRNAVRAMRDYAGLPPLGSPGAPKASEVEPDC